MATRASRLLAVPSSPPWRRAPGLSLSLADEPIAHQDLELAEAVMFVLRQLAEGGTACLVATHNELAFEAADRVLELHDGQLRPRA